jgi:malonyl-CoA O-methyltransferase
LQGDARRLPLQTGCADLIVANMLLPWIDDLPGCLAEIARVLRKDGVFVFSSLGPDSLSEIRKAWSTVDQEVHVNPYPDMHDIGDAMVRAGLRDPVLDVDAMSVSYEDTASMYRDLTHCGARNCLEQRRHTLTGKRRFQAMENALRGNFADGRLTFGLELVYGHAWSGGPPQEPGEFRLDPATIGRRQR